MLKIVGTLKLKLLMVGLSVLVLVKLNFLLIYKLKFYILNII